MKQGLHLLGKSPLGILRAYLREEADTSASLSIKITATTEFTPTDRILGIFALIKIILKVVGPSTYHLNKLIEVDYGILRQPPFTLVNNIRSQFSITYLVFKKPQTIFALEHTLL